MNIRIFGLIIGFAAAPLAQAGLEFEKPVQSAVVKVADTEIGTKFAFKVTGGKPVKITEIRTFCSCQHPRGVRDHAYSAGLAGGGTGRSQDGADQGFRGRSGRSDRSGFLPRDHQGGSAGNHRGQGIRAVRDASGDRYQGAGPRQTGNGQQISPLPEALGFLQYHGQKTGRACATGDKIAAAPSSS